MAGVAVYNNVNSFIQKNSKDETALLHEDTLQLFLSFSSEKRFNDIFREIFSDIDTGKLKERFKKYKMLGKQGFIQPYFKNNRYYFESKRAKISLLNIGGYGQIYKIDKDTVFKINIPENDHWYHEYDIPNHLSSIVDSDMRDFVLFPQSIVKDCVFNGLINVIRINIFFVYLIYVIKKGLKFDKFVVERKLNDHSIEQEYISLFKNGNNEYVEDVVDWYNFLVNDYLYPDERFSILDHLPKLASIFRLRKGEIKKGFVIILPFNNTSSNKLIIDPETKEISSSHNGVLPYTVYPLYYRMLILQMFILILSINKRIFFSHNDFKPDNVLVKKRYGPYEMDYGDKLSFRFTEPFSFLLADFDFSYMINKESNNKINKNKQFSNTNCITDVHYFVHILFYYLPTEAMKADEEFFCALHKNFIAPYCKTTVNELLFDRYKNKEEHCNGRLTNVKKDNKEVIEKFIESSFFSSWRNI